MAKEHEILTKCNHPYIVKCYEAYETDDIVSPPMPPPLQPNDRENSAPHAPPPPPLQVELKRQSR